MASSTNWNWEEYREQLRRRAETLRLDSRMQVRFDESDLVQRTLLKAIDPATPPCEGTTPRQHLAWLFKIMERRLLDMYDEHFGQKRDIRQEKREADARAMQGAFDDSAAAWLPQLPADHTEPPERAARAEEQELLDRALAQLPEREQTVMRLRLKENLSLTEIADRLGETPGAISGVIRRAEARLKSLLNPDEESHHG